MAITNDNLSVRRLDKDERKKVYRDWMTKQFPKDELKPLSAIERTIMKGLYEAWGMWDGEELVTYGMLGFSNPGSAVLLDYLGVKPERMHMGYGSAFLKKLSEIYEGWKAVIIESENPEYIEGNDDRATAVKRLGFYDRNGCIDSGLKVKLFGVEFNVLVMAINDRYEDVSILRRHYEDIYRGFLSNTYFNKFVRTHF